MLAKFVLSSLTVVALTESWIPTLLTFSTSLVSWTGKACFFGLNLDRDGPDGLATTFLGFSVDGDILLRFRGVSSGKSTSDAESRFELSAIDTASPSELESAEDMSHIENKRLCVKVAGWSLEFEIFFWSKTVSGHGTVHVRLRSAF